MASVKGQDVAKLTLVVGRENPKIKANLNFAKQLKSLTMRKTPDSLRAFSGGEHLIRICPTGLSLLKSVPMKIAARCRTRNFFIAATVPRAVGTKGRPAQTQPAKVTQRTGSWSAVGWILVLLIVGGAAYLYLATGSWAELQRQVRRFLGRELKELRSRNRDSDDKP